jgi:hypothetical protein
VLSDAAIVVVAKGAASRRTLVVVPSVFCWVAIKATFAHPHLQFAYHEDFPTIQKTTILWVEAPIIGHINLLNSVTTASDRSVALNDNYIVFISGI